MADRGQWSRDDEPRPIPVSELLAASKRSLDPPPEPPVGDWFAAAADSRVGAQHRDTAGDDVLEQAAAEPMPADTRLTAVVAADDDADDHADEADDDHADAVGVAAASRRRNGGRALPWALGAAATVAALTGALVVGELMTGDGRADNPADDTVAAAGPAGLTGAEVFRPDLIRASLETGDDAGVAPEQAAPGSDESAGTDGSPADGPGGGNTDAGGSDTTGSGQGDDDGDGVPKPASQPDQQPDQQPEQQQPSGPQADQPQAGPTTSRPQSPTPTSRPGGNRGGLLDPILGPILQPVLGFYAAAPDEPERAFALLGPSMRRGSVEDFARSWADVRDAEVRDAEAVGDDTLVVDVALIRDDGSTLLTTQRIVVDDGVRPTIVDAQLLAVDRG